MIEQSVIKISDLNMSFGEHEVLKNFNLTVGRGENIAVMGKSGCGKSVLIKCITRLLEPDSGTIITFGKNIAELGFHDLDLLRARIGFVFQNSALYDSMTVRENLEFPLRRHGKDKSRKEINHLVEETLDTIGLLYAIDQMPSELSGGMRKRVGLARAIILKPEIILYDEPTTGLDPATAKEITNLMLEIQKLNNTSSIIISHDVNCVKKTASSICMLIDGINYKQGSYPELSKITDPKIHCFFE